MISYDPSNEGAEYLNDLHELKPILVHRHLAFKLGFPLTEEERLQHQVKAYLMLKEEYPNKELSWVNTKHPSVAASLEHVKANKPLKFPRGFKTRE